MLKVKTVTRASEIHGIGLFADQDIAKGTVVWVFESDLDISVSKEGYESLPEVQKHFFDHYGYWSDQLDLYICAADGWRYTNHSEKANVVTVNLATGCEGQDVAIRDIKKGEELLFDYRSFGEDPTKVDG
ncbi:SET domain-containing protein [Candidatus Uhrbacteria bacterium]|nr:SET domain-containing protein [Candidatus Uhrbacteria bacterium]